MSARLPYGGSIDALVPLPLAERFRWHAEALVRTRRSPLSAQLMFDAAADIDAGGSVAQLFSEIPLAPGAVPQLRLLAALHHLVLAGRADELALYYPSVNGRRSPSGVWPAALGTIDDHSTWLRARVRRTVQTNEPGRAAVLFAALLWLSERYRLPIRLLEIGASAGLNLLPDRYCYLVDGVAIGDPSSPVRFEEPWRPGPVLGPRAAARRLRVSTRAGCDLRPLDPREPEDRLTLLSYVWPDELDRLGRLRHAIDIACQSPVQIDATPAEEWLAERLRHSPTDELTVIWQSIIRQYIAPEPWAGIERAVRDALDAAPEMPVVWVTMEPSEENTRQIKLAYRLHPDQTEARLAWCGDHGPPVRWGVN